MILVLKMTKKYHITWYWCQNIKDNMVEKRVKRFGQGPPPPPLFGQCPKEIDLFYVRSSLSDAIISTELWELYFDRDQGKMTCQSPTRCCLEATTIKFIEPVLLSFSQNVKSYMIEPASSWCWWHKLETPVFLFYFDYYLPITWEFKEFNLKYEKSYNEEAFASVKNFRPREKNECSCKT